jgi:SAM-dependent methyltransferase
MSKSIESTTTSDAYGGAVDHYLSPDRRDAVKCLWEEPATRKLLDDAVGRLAGDGPLRVLDVGCGAGDGLSLLRSAPRSRRRPGVLGSLHYTGLDLDENLLDAARRLHGETDNIQFLHGDVRSEIPAGAFDMYLSFGVPYSHLTVTELRQVLRNIFAAARANPRPVVVIVDVLGRYSIEWTSRWENERWPYRMSFFRSERTAASTDMTCYSGADLRATIRDAAHQAGCPLSEIDCYDRSIMVGRHTTTGGFTPNLRPYRQLVNDLVDPDVDVDYDQLLFDVTLPGAPSPIPEFFSDFSRTWNALITQVREFSHMATSHDHITRVLQPMLAHGLERLESVTQQCLGVGHSLAAVAYTQPAA